MSIETLRKENLTKPTGTCATNVSIPFTRTIKYFTRMLFVKIQSTGKSYNTLKYFHKIPYASQRRQNTSMI